MEFGSAKPRLPASLPAALLELRQDVHGVDEHHASTPHGIDLQVRAHGVDHAVRVAAHVCFAREEIFGAEGEDGGYVFLGSGDGLGGG